MNVLILGLNYVPEPVGIGPYTAGMAVSLAAAGHRVAVVCAKPYYPHWRIDPAFAGGGPRISVEDGVRVVRLPIYVPRRPGGKRRLAHHASFAIRAQAALIAEGRRSRPDVILAIAPSLISTIAARAAARLFGARLWLHIQDFEAEAAFATGLLAGSGLLARAARRFESWALGADRVSAISPRMCAKLAEKGIAPANIREVRNWADVETDRAAEAASRLRSRWNLDRPHLAIYSGNIGGKQGMGIIVEAARRLQHRRDLMFLVCGNGPGRRALASWASGLDNIRFEDLQPREGLPDLLALASVHLLPQIAGAADCVLPSKLTNMLASGRPIVATAAAGTALEQEIAGCGIATPPGDGARFAAAICRLLDDEPLRAALGRAATRRAAEHWNRARILARFEAQLRDLAA